MMYSIYSWSFLRHTDPEHLMWWQEEVRVILRMTSGPQSLAWRYNGDLFSAVRTNVQKLGTWKTLEEMSKTGHLDSNGWARSQYHVGYKEDCMRTKYQMKGQI